MRQSTISLQHYRTYTPVHKGHPCRSLLQSGLKMNSCFNRKSFKSNLWTLLPLVNGSESEQNLMWLPVFYSSGRSGCTQVPPPELNVSDHVTVTMFSMSVKFPFLSVGTHHETLVLCHHKSDSACCIEAVKNREYHKGRLQPKWQRVGGSCVIHISKGLLNKFEWTQYFFILFIRSITSNI